MIQVKGEGDVRRLNNLPPQSINILVHPLNSDLIWTAEKDMVGVYLPDRAKKNGKATGFRDIILEETAKKVFNRITEKIRNPAQFPAHERMNLQDPMPLNQKLNMNKKDDLYK